MALVKEQGIGDDRRMKETIRKAIRTAQSSLPFLKDAKDVFYRHSRRLLRRPHEREFHALKLIPASLGGCYVDVGANHGQSIESILLFKPAARIVAFEANPQLAKRLQQRYAGRNAITVVGSGLAGRADRFTLFVPSYCGFLYDGLASLDRRAASTWLSPKTIFGFDPGKLAIEEIVCRVETLDAHRLQPIFIKIDVQGYEYHVLEGARQTLMGHEPVLMIEDYRGDARTVRLAEELGYDEFHFADGAFRRGASGRENSFLLTERRLHSLASAGRTASA